MQELTNQTLQEKRYFVTFYSIIGAVVLAIFGLSHMLSNSLLLGVLELGASLTMTLNIIGLRLTRNVPLACKLLLIIIIGVLMIMLVTGGINGTGIFWFFIFPPAAFFLTNRLQGAMWIAGLYTMTLVVLLLSQVPLTRVPYSIVTIRQMLVCLFVLSISIYIYQQSRERSALVSEESQQDLQEYLDNMTTFSAKISLDGTILFANKIAKQVTGMGERLIGANFLTGTLGRVSSDVNDKVKRAFSRAKAGEMVSYDESLAAGPNERPTTYNLSLIPIFQEDRIAYVLAEGRDVTAIKESEIKLKAKTDDLERLNKLMVGRELKMMELKSEIRKRGGDL